MTAPVEVSVGEIVAATTAVIGMVGGALAYCIKIGSSLGEVKAGMKTQADEIDSIQSAQIVSDKEGGEFKSVLTKLDTIVAVQAEIIHKLEKRVEVTEQNAKQGATDAGARLSLLEASQAAIQVSDRTTREQLNRMMDTLERIDAAVSDLRVRRMDKT